MLWAALIVSWVLVPDIPSESPHPRWRAPPATFELNASPPAVDSDDDGVLPPRAIAMASSPELQRVCPILPFNRPSSNRTAIRAPPA